MADQATCDASPPGSLDQVDVPRRARCGPAGNGEAPDGLAAVVPYGAALVLVGVVRLQEDRVLTVEDQRRVRWDLPGDLGVERVTVTAELRVALGQGRKGVGVDVVRVGRQRRPGDGMDRSGAVGELEADPVDVV